MVIETKKKDRIEPGIHVFHDPEPDLGFHQRTKTFDPETGDVSDASTRIDDLVRESKRKEQQEWEQKLIPYHQVRDKLNAFRHAWNTKSLESMGTVNQTLDAFLANFNNNNNNTPTWVREKILREDLSSLANHLSAYKDELVILLGFINNLEQICKKEQGQG